MLLLSRSTKNAKIPATGGAIFVHCKSASQSDCYEFGKVLLDRLESIDAVQRAEAVFGFKYKGAHDREEDSAAGFDISGVKSCASVHDTPVRFYTYSLYICMYIFVYMYVPVVKV